MNIASRLSALYAVLLGITVLAVILASSVALYFELDKFTGDILIAKHEEARILVNIYSREGMSLAQAAPEIVNSLSGIGLRVTVFNERGDYLAGDKTFRPRALDRVLKEGGIAHFNPSVARQPPGRVLPPPPDAATHDLDPLPLAEVNGGYVGFDRSELLLLGALVPYWRVVLTIALVAMLLSWFFGRVFAAQSLAPINAVTASLRALAQGDYTQRKFIMAGGDEIASLTAAFNDAVANVATAMEDRRRAEERISQFAADASHELRTPLTVIAGYIDVLRRGAIDEPKIARQILATMSLEKEHMRSLIDRLMRLARLDSEMGPRVEAIDVPEFLRQQCEAVRRLDDRRAIDYSVDGVATIDADPGELAEAMWNIIENALKYAPDAPIHLRAARTNGHTVISVRDEGPGMSESERVHAFERFYRGDQRGEIAGTGLGLAIAKRAVERAGGAIAIESTPGRGTAVTITIEGRGARACLPPGDGVKSG